MNNRWLRYLFCLLLLPFTVGGQQIYIRGEITDEQGNPLANTAILQQSTGYLIRAGATGGFGILSNRRVDTLVFSQDGFLSRKLAAHANEYLKVVLKRKPATAGSVSRLASFTQNLSRELQQPWLMGNETYASLVENGFVPSVSFPSTGIRLNVDRASYSNVRRFIKMGTPVPPDAVRIEEMINYFNFRYQEPPPGETFALRPLLTNCPWNPDNQLLLVQLSSRRIMPDSLPPSHLTFLIDVSGSMDMPNRLPLLKSGFRGLVQNLRERDSVSIVVYGGTVGVWLPTTGGSEKEKIFRAIDSLEPGGATPGASGVKMAYSVAQNHFIKGGNNRVILATDGDFNVGLRSETELEELIANQTRAGIYLTCLGVGMGNYKDSKIQALAQKGHGNFAYIDSYAEAEKVLLQEFMQTLYTVADDASFTVQFDPAYVKSYRLVGFDNKVGAIHDTLATIEGGEIGSAYATLLLFEVEPRLPGSLQAYPAEFLLRYRLPNQQQRQQQALKPLVAFVPWSSLHPDYQFAGSVALFGMLLRNSKYCKQAGFDDVLRLAQPAVEKGSLLQEEFLGLVQQAKNIYGKKRKRRIT